MFYLYGIMYSTVCLRIHGLLWIMIDADIETTLKRVDGHLKTLDPPLAIKSY